MRFESHLGHSVSAGERLFVFLLLTKLDILASSAAKCIGLRRCVPHQMGELEGREYARDGSLLLGPPRPGGCERLATAVTAVAGVPAQKLVRAGQAVGPGPSEAARPGLPGSILAGPGMAPRHVPDITSF
jgi:hypothetical protein